MTYKTISFYKYTSIKNPKKLQEQLKKDAISTQIKGRMLIGKEGINGAVAGLQDHVEAFKKKIKAVKELSDLTFREQSTPLNPYRKVITRVRTEIVHFSQPVDMKKKGDYISPEELHKQLEGKKKLVLLDVRNDYETKVGKFKNAVTLPLKTFREFPEAIKSVVLPKETPIVTYCTGGIRCEKASAYLKEQGFTNVQQIEGGIITYLTKYPKGFFEGSCFVFDDRLTPQSYQPITVCEHCKKQAETYINCHNMDCDQLVILCHSCQDQMHKSCSEVCKQAPRRRKEPHKWEYLECIGNVENYYQKRKIALINLKKGTLAIENKIVIVGKTTTEFEQRITDLRDFNGATIAAAKKGQLITIPITNKVRKNDRIFFVA